MNLYELSENYRAVEAMADDPEADPQAIIDTLEGIEGEITEKADNIACMIKSLDYEIFAVSSEIEALKSRKKAKERAVSSLKEYLKNAMESMGRSKIETARSKISIRSNAEKVIITDLESLLKLDWARKIHIPDENDINKTELKQRLSEGYEVEGAHLERSKSLIIK